ncbi:MAG: hypothetical protein M3Y93_12885 [Pseudomonadota bacterium]|nr:hypothetical protein [Pseudomonadota bacterium]
MVDLGAAFALLALAMTLAVLLVTWVVDRNQTANACDDGPSMPLEKLFPCPVAGGAVTTD